MCYSNEAGMARRTRSRRAFLAAAAGTTAGLSGCWRVRSGLGLLPDPTPVRTAADDWPGARGGPRRSGANSASVAPNLEGESTTSFDLVGPTTPVLGTAEGVYVGTHATEASETPGGDGSGATVHGLSPAGDSLRWTVDLGSLGYGVAAGHGWVYVPTGSGRVVAFDAAGVRHHRADLPTDDRAGIAVGEAAVYAWTGDGTVFGLSPDLETTRWTWEAPDRVGGIAVGDDRLAVVTGRSVRGLSTTGETVWSVRHRTDGSEETTPVAVAVAHGRAYIAGGRKGRLSAVDLADGDRVWRRSFDGRVSAPAVADSILVTCGIGERTLVAVETDGDDLWRTETLPEAGPPVIAGDAAYLVGQSAATRHRLADGTRVGQADFSGLSITDQRPAVDGGRLRVVLSGFDTSHFGALLTL